MYRRRIKVAVAAFFSKGMRLLLFESSLLTLCVAGAKQQENLR